MKRYLKELKPTVFDDIVAMVALYRPGPMQWISDFIDRKHGKTEITYLHPTMQPALETTYGVIVYQEQVMQISKEMCGFTGGQADTLRKGIGKKIPEVLAKLKGDFIEGAIETNNVPRELVEQLWGNLEDFAAYCFNKSHAACYALIAYQTAYLKAHYPSAFMAALMTSDWDNIDRLAIEITECKHMGIEVLPPSVNSSFHEFSVANDKSNPKAPIRFGMDAIKNVGKGAVEEILLAREDGEFSSLNDFISRVNSRIVNRKTWESLIKTGAMDEFGDRGSLLNTLDVILSLGTKIQKERSSAQVDLFGSSDDPTTNMPSIQLIAPAEEVAAHSYLLWERELLGLYLSHHPLDDFGPYLEEHTVPIHTLTEEMDDAICTIGGTIADIRQITTKNGQNMAFVKLEDRSGEIELVIFPNLYKDSASIWQRDTVVEVVGRVSARDKNGTLSQDIKFLPDSAKIIELATAQGFTPSGKKPEIKHKNPKSRTKKQSAKKTVTKLYLRVIDDTKPALLHDIKLALDEFKGASEVVLVLGEPAKKQAVKLPFTVTIEEGLTRRLADIVGTTNVVVQ
jgi:DNA polymerase-3 subunit alpha